MLMPLHTVTIKRKSGVPKINQNLKKLSKISITSVLNVILLNLIVFLKNNRKF